MRIGVDVRCFAQGKNTGIEEYTKKILDAIFKQDCDNEYILFFNAWHKQNVDFSWALSHKNVSIKKYAIPNKLLNFSLWFLQYPKLDKLCGGVDVFFMPNSNFCAVSSKTKLFLTIHDLSFEHYKHSFSWKRRVWHFFVNPRLLVSGAYHIFAVSEATKSDLYVTYGIKKEKITVTRNGTTSVEGKYDRNSIELVKVKEKYKLPYQFVLYFGTIEPRKNIINIIKAYDLLRKSDENIKHKLVIAGARGWKGEDIHHAVHTAQFQNDIIMLIDVPEDEKELIYALSSVFIYPSFFEGFGFPPLEAMMNNVPVISSHTTSLPEIVGSNA
ncbi:MAG: glycosyltransferase family 1 protein, partial [Patescibacteria group bacterium]|nr:glycosyltransferase family 1 protein [Patescibacteria group bacterium]